MISGADTAWLLIASALVMLMTPGLAFFYGGMVRSKNVLNTLFLSFIALVVITFEWVVIGYSMSFGDDIGGVIGGLNNLFLHGVGLKPSPNYASTVPALMYL